MSTDYDWRVSVRVTGTRNGWSSTLVDSPTFEFRSNPQFGGIWSSADSVAAAVRDMFVNMLQPTDLIHVTVAGMSSGAVSSFTFDSVED